MAKKIRLSARVLSENDRAAADLARQFDKARVFVPNLMSSPGAGKTTLLEETARRLGKELRLAAIEGDLATDRDAERLRRAGIPTHQINTGGGCHLSAVQVAEALTRFNLEDLDILFIENVGNLVCPAEFDLGEHARVVLASTPEGDDKPIKYPIMFHAADCVVLNKIDMEQAAGFSREAFRGFVRELKPDVPILELSCRTGDGMDRWIDWLRQRREAVSRGEDRRCV